MTCLSPPWTGRAERAAVARAFDSGCVVPCGPCAPAFHRAGVALDNARFPSDWAERTGACAGECADCGYCESVFTSARR